MSTLTTPIERFNNASEEEQKKIVKMLTDSTFKSHGYHIVLMRRERYAEILSVGNLSYDEVFNLIKAREDDFIEEYSDPNLPNWFLRMEAQDVLMEFIYERVVKEEEAK